MNELAYIGAISSLNDMSRVDPDVEVTIEDVEEEPVNRNGKSYRPFL